MIGKNNKFLRCFLFVSDLILTCIKNKTHFLIVTSSSLQNSVYKILVQRFVSNKPSLTLFRYLDKTFLWRTYIKLSNSYFEGVTSGDVAGQSVLLYVFVAMIARDINHWNVRNLKKILCFPIKKQENILCRISLNWLWKVLPNRGCVFLRSI